MNLIVTANETQVCFETRVSFTPSECRLFLDSLVSWVRDRVTCACSFIHADIPIKVINDHLPYGSDPVRFLWDMLIDAHYQVTASSLAY